MHLQIMFLEIEETYFKDKIIQKGAKSPLARDSRFPF